MNLDFKFALKHWLPWLRHFRGKLASEKCLLLNDPSCISHVMLNEWSVLFLTQRVYPNSASALLNSPRVARRRSPLLAPLLPELLLPMCSPSSSWTRVIIWKHSLSSGATCTVYVKSSRNQYMQRRRWIWHPGIIKSGLGQPGDWISPFFNERQFSNQWIVYVDLWSFKDLALKCAQYSLWKCDNPGIGESASGFQMVRNNQQRPKIHTNVMSWIE